MVQLGDRPTSETTYTVVGTRPIRHDGLDKVTGRALYGNDIQVPGRIFGRILRSPHAHARILGIDTARAEALPGVRAVVTGRDFPSVSGRLADQPEGGIHNLGFLSLNSMARDKVLFRGHPVAAVAADTAAIAEQALALVDVRYEVLPVVLDGLQSMSAEAPIILPDLKTNANANFRGGGLRDDGEPLSHSNIANHFVLEIGDVANGFEEADVILEHDYRTGAAHQGYIEPQAATALWQPDGTLTIWNSSQGHFAVRDLTAVMVGLPPGNVKVIPSEIGGGFGAKTVTTIEPVAAMLSRKSGKPVKIAISRAEVFESQGPTSGTFIHLKMGVTNDGRLTAADARLVYEAGAFPGSPVSPGAQYMFASYEIPNARAEGFDVLVNKPKALAYRAPGSPAAAFAVESMIDELAEKVGMDPLELRWRNAAREGTKRINGLSSPKIGVMETLEAAEKTPHYLAPLPGKNRGRGIAGGFWGNATGPASVIASVLPDGQVSLVEGSPDIGGTRTSVAMQFAEVLGLPIESVHPRVGDTDSVGFTSPTGGSSTTFKTGWAAYEAALDVKRQMVERAAKIWTVDPGDVTYEAGTLINGRNPEQRFTFEDLARRLIATGGAIVGRSTVLPRTPGGSYGLHIADVEVDPETGKVTILRYTALQDAGRAIHPAYVEGQLQGGSAQGIGWALNEEYVYDEGGRMLNASFLDYRMPTALDLPLIETVIVEAPNPGHPMGVRGVGETPIVPPLAALANAVYRATGTRLRELPMSPGRILEALAGQG